MDRPLYEVSETVRFRNNVPKYVRFDFNAYMKMFCYCLGAKGEISGFAKSRKIRDKKEPYFLITEVRIFKQKNTQSHTELSSEDLSNFIIELAQAKENPRDWNVWWHTHFDFNAFFSGIDVNTILKLSEKSELIAVCINQRGEITARYDSKGYTQPLIPTVLPDKKSKLYETCLKEIKEKVVNVPYRRMYGSSYKGKKIKFEVDEAEVLAPTGLGESTEVIEIDSYTHRGRGYREFHSDLS